MFRRGVQMIGTVAAGAALDRMSQPAKPTEARRPPASLRRGDTLLDGLARRTRLPEDAQNPVLHGMQSQIDNRIGVGKKLADVVTNPQRAVQQASQMVEDVKSDVQLIQGAAKIAQGGALTTGDGARIAKAAAESTGSKIMAAVRGGFAAATTTHSSVDNLGQSVAERAEHEAKSAVSGLAISQMAAAAVGMIPHPAAKAASAAIRATGQLAAGSKMSEGMREVGGHIDGPVRKEIAAIAREKADKA